MTVGVHDWEKRAAAGNEVAQSVLGCTLVLGGEIDGERLEANYIRALGYLQSAANAGCSRPTAFLGVLYEDGLGVPEDLPRAISLFERAAEADEYLAVLHAARLYADGRLGYRDLERARFWYERLLQLADEDDVDVDDDIDGDGDEIAEAKTFIASGILPPSAQRARGRF